MFNVYVLCFCVCAFYSTTAPLVDTIQYLNLIFIHPVFIVEMHLTFIVLQLGYDCLPKLKIAQAESGFWALWKWLSTV